MYQHSKLPQAKSPQAKSPQEKNILFLIAVLTSSCFLSSCTSYEESFSTEPGTGSGWKSMSDTYALGHVSDQKEKETENTLEKDVRHLDPLYKDAISDAQRDALYCSGKSESIDRLPEEYLRVWIAPYQDPSGNMVEGYYVRSRMKQGQWVITSADASVVAEQNCGASS
ncbi:MAG: TraV family lipoprotein [Alphaproteobacteria bacterium]|nr:TraV family lipoprotein [Alphaproteobacteria bacterium]